jgi:DNA-binding transcriptional MerR regulator
MNIATIPEIARLKGVTRQAIEQYRDIRGIEPTGKRGRASLYRVSDFDDTAKPKRQPSEWRELYEKERALKMQILNAKARGELIERVFVARVFSEIFSIERSILLNIGPSMSDTIAAIEEKSEGERALKIQQIIDKEIYGALGAIKAAINKFFRKFDIDEITDDIPEAKPRNTAAKGKRKKPR